MIEDSTSMLGGQPNVSLSIATAAILHIWQSGVESERYSVVKFVEKITIKILVCIGIYYHRWRYLSWYMTARKSWRVSDCTYCRKLATDS